MGPCRDAHARPEVGRRARLTVGVTSPASRNPIRLRVLHHAESSGGRKKDCDNACLRKRDAGCCRCVLHDFALVVVSDSVGAGSPSVEQDAEV